MVTWRRKPSESAATPTRSSRGRRLARWLLRFGTGIILVVILLLVALLASGSLRARLMAAAWDRAGQAVPGTVTVGRFEWPELNHLRLTNVAWRDSTDLTTPLAEADRLEVWLDLGALRTKDVRVDSLHVVVPWLDGPVLTELLAAHAATRPDTAAVDQSEGFVFPRPGAIRGLPSLAVSRWRLDVARAQLTPEAAAIGVRATGGLEAGHGRPGRVFVDHLEGHLETVTGASPKQTPVEVSLHHLGLGLSLGAEHDSTKSLDSFVAEIDSLTLHFDAGAPGLQSFLQVNVPHTAYDQISGRLSLNGTFDSSRLALTTDLDLASTPWLDRGHLRAHVIADSAQWASLQWQDAAVVIDTLDFSLLGTEARGSGKWQEGQLELGLRAAMADPRLVALFRPEVPAQAAAVLDLEARVGGTWQLPTATVDLTGSLDLPQARVPRLSLQVTGDLRQGNLALSLPQGLTVADANLDSLAARLQVTRVGPDSLSGEFTIAARRGTDRVSFGGFVRADTLGRMPDNQVRLDSLAVTRGGRIMRAANSVWVSRRAGVYRGAYAAEFVLPGTAEFQSFLPPDFPHAEYGPIVGRLKLTGAYRQPELNLTLDLDLTPTPWLSTGLLRARLVGDPEKLSQKRYRDATVALDTMAFDLPGAQLRASGSLRQENLDLALRATVADARLAALWRSELTSDSELNLNLEAQVAGTLPDPTLVLDLRGRADGPGVKIPEVSLQATGGRNGAEASLHLPAGMWLADVTLDSLAVQTQAARAGTDSLQGAFALTARRGPERVALGGLAWSGSPGRMSGKRVRLDSLIILSPSRQMRLHEPTTITLGPGPLDIAITPLLFTGEPGEIRLSGRADAAEFNLDSGVDLLLSGGLMDRVAPNDIWSTDGGNDLSLVADAGLTGTRAAPRLAGRVSARLVPRSGASELGLEVDFALTGNDTSGLRADLALTAADTMILRGQFSLPGQVDPRTGQWQHLSNRPAQVLLPEQTLNPSLFNQLLPPEVAVRGPVTVGADIKAPAWADSTTGDSSPRLGSLAGVIRTTGLEVELPNRSRMVLGTNLKLGGTVGAPRLAGRIVVESGFFRLPEIPRNLHPVQGNTMLWSLAAADTIAGDSPPRAALSGPTAPIDRPPNLPDLDLEVHLPGNLRVYGYGLDVELDGDLRVSRGFDANDLPRPKIQGTMQSVQGTLRFMNRNFTVVRGEIRFRGALPADPELDMLLQTTVNGTIVRITVGGQATNPVITLSSDPEYEEADVMAVLLFGRPVGELEDAERSSVRGGETAGQQLRQNLAGLAVVFGTAGLQNSVTSTVGVDMVELGSDSAGGSTLMVGKFINPRLMVKYHHSLEKSGTYFLTMEYALSQLFKVVSTYGQGEENSGLELKWSRRY